VPIVATARYSASDDLRHGRDARLTLAPGNPTMAWAALRPMRSLRRPTTTWRLRAAGRIPAGGRLGERATLTIALDDDVRSAPLARCGRQNAVGARPPPPCLGIDKKHGPEPPHIWHDVPYVGEAGTTVAAPDIVGGICTCGWSLASVLRSVNYPA